MASHPGEERLVTVFADVHYYFSEPVPRPYGDRFDNGSYLYLHGNTSGTGARLEIANHVGKPEQDAFTGSLESSVIRQSYKHPTLVTVTVNGYHAPYAVGDASSRRPEHHWKLPHANPLLSNNLPQQLHTVDLYFWTAQDADTFVSAVRRLLNAEQLQLLDFPPTPAAHDDVASPVVQNLEKLAVRDGAGSAAYNRNSRTASVAQSQQSTSAHTSEVGTNETALTTTSDSYQPLAYNPAAPAAPEPIAHREKTPPPPDADQGTGLAAAATADHSQSIAPQSSLSRPPYGLQHSSSGYVGGPPIQPHMAAYQRSSSSAAYAGSPQSAGIQRAPSFPPTPTGRPPQPMSPHSQTPTFAGPPTMNPPSAVSPSSNSQQLVRRDTSSSQFQRNEQPAASPASEIIGNSYVTAHHQPLQHVQPHYPDYLASGHQAPGPIGGYSNFQYGQQNQQGQSQGVDYDIHNQLYRPTEDEYHHGKPPKNTSSAGRPPTGRLESGAEKVDKGMNRLFKKIEKKIG